MFQSYVKNLLCAICLRFDWVMEHLLCDKGNIM